MAENVNSTPARSGRGCFGCFFGFTLAVLLLAAVIVAGVVVKDLIGYKEQK